MAKAEALLGFDLSDCWFDGVILLTVTDGGIRGTSFLIVLLLVEAAGLLDEDFFSVLVTDMVLGIDWSKLLYDAAA